MHSSKIMLCIKKSEEWTKGWTNGQTNAPEAIYPSNFFKVGSIKSMQCKNSKLQMDMKYFLEFIQKLIRSSTHQYQSIHQDSRL